MKKILRRLLCASLGLLNLSAMAKSSKFAMPTKNSEIMDSRKNTRKLQNKPLMEKYKEVDTRKSHNVKNDELFVSNHGGVSHFKKLKNGKFEITCADGAKIVVPIMSFLIIVGAIVYSVMPVNIEQAFENFGNLPNRKNAYIYLNALKRVIVKEHTKDKKYVFSPGYVLDEIFSNYKSKKDAINFIKKLAKAILANDEFEITKNTQRNKIFPKRDPETTQGTLEKDLELLKNLNSGRELNNKYTMDSTKVYLGENISTMLKNNQNAIAQIAQHFMFTDSDFNFNILPNDYSDGMENVRVSFDSSPKDFGISKQQFNIFEKDEIYGDAFMDDIAKRSKEVKNYVYGGRKGSWKNFIYTVTLVLMHVGKW